MPRPNKTREQRERLLPIVARAFAELGYRRATTAALAERCGVQENILFRLWPNKKGMFLAAIDHVFGSSALLWQGLLAKRAPGASAADQLLDYEAEHHGDFRHYRIIFAGLNELDDPEIAAMLALMYKRFHEFIRLQIAAHRRQAGGAKPGDLDPGLLAWAFIGLGTVAGIGRELGLLPDARRKDLIRKAGSFLLDSKDAGGRRS